MARIAEPGQRDPDVGADNREPGQRGDDPDRPGRVPPGRAPAGGGRRQTDRAVTNPAAPAVPSPARESAVEGITLCITRTRRRYRQTAIMG